MFILFICVSVYLFFSVFYNLVIKYIPFKTFFYKTIIVIFYIIIMVVIITMYHLYFGPEVYAQTFTDTMENGTVNRTPLVQPGQTFRNLAHGTYPVTGGHVNIGFLGGGTVTKVIGIMVNNYPATVQGFNYAPCNQPFNHNFASVLYELRHAGQNNCSYSSLDYYYPGRVMPQANLNMQYLLSYRSSIGLVTNPEIGEVSITNRLLNGLAQ